MGGRRVEDFLLRRRNRTRLRELRQTVFFRIDMGYRR